MQPLSLIFGLVRTIRAIENKSNYQSGFSILEKNKPSDLLIELRKNIEFCERIRFELFARCIALLIEENMNNP